MNYQKEYKYPNNIESSNKQENESPNFHIGFWTNEVVNERKSKFQTQYKKSQNRHDDSKYKTRICFWTLISNYCHYGRKCIFAHSASELRRHPKYKTVLCNKFRTLKGCPYSENCHYIHFLSEARGEITQEMIREATYNSAFYDDINAAERSFNGMSI
ncbi:Zinc finger protein 36, C3H1 type-like 2 [Trichinella pseudospiralis]|uniref:Zinc finger protein 36, C3H1 type-like 2 n=1 Tax=Trichinella pseudospiralis TaxID=6337 RepID=A0A0V1F8Y9_TRIPS|nr:Zinc finger protein 36, C3H1 type-like 2 [Trichinella pseudospiralis]KRY82602.1 Zinc finger protein 36, C3H1 type-like 2 [Trichinella pseudospiralis]